MDQTDVLALIGFVLLVAGVSAIAFVLAGPVVAGALVAVIVGLTLLIASQTPELG